MFLLLPYFVVESHLLFHPFGDLFKDRIRVTKVGKDLQDQPDQPSTYHQYFPTKLCPSVQHLTFLKHFPGGWPHHLPGQPIPVPGHSFREETVPNIQPESPLAQLEATPSSLHLGAHIMPLKSKPFISELLWFPEGKGKDKTGKTTKLMCLLDREWPIFLHLKMDAQSSSNHSLHFSTGRETSMPWS